jgi:hypothetical protein
VRIPMSLIHFALVLIEIRAPERSSHLPLASLDGGAAVLCFAPSLP